MNKIGVKMEELKEFTISFSGLKLGIHRFDFEIKKPFFEHFEYDEFNDVDVDVEVILEKKSTFLEFTLNFKGTVNVACDVTNELFDQPVSGSYVFVVKFGDTYNDEDADILIIPVGSFEVNIQQPIYESIILAVPLRRVHPGVEDGTLKSEILDKLEELRPKYSGEELEKPEAEKTEDTEETDPRWDELKKLLTDK